MSPDNKGNEMQNTTSEQIFDSFNGRIKNSLGRNGIHTTEQLLTKTEIDLLHFSNMGLRSVEEIVKTLKKHGLALDYIPNQYSAVYVRGKMRKRKKTNRVSKAIKVLLTGK